MHLVGESGIDVGAYTSPTPHPPNKMHLKAILNHVEKQKGFVYHAIRWDNDRTGLLVSLRPHGRSQPVCSGCDRKGPCYGDSISCRFGRSLCAFCTRCGEWIVAAAESLLRKSRGATSIARRSASEMLRSQREDIDFHTGQIRLREKKRLRGSRSTRSVPMSATLRKTLTDWFAVHPGGLFTFTLRGDEISRDQAHDYFARTVAETRWNVLRGWHVLRHSFISNCAFSGIDQRMIDSWISHSSEAVKRRYRHLSQIHSQKLLRVCSPERVRPVSPPRSDSPLQVCRQTLTAVADATSASLASRQLASVSLYWTPRCRPPERMNLVSEFN